MLSKISRKILRTAWLTAFALVCLFSCCLGASAQTIVNDSLTTLSIEQIRAQMPRVQVFVHGRDGTAVPQLYLDGDLLSYSGELATEDISTSYYVMLDISGSIRSDYFEAAKEQIAALADQMSESDQMTLITFGDSVNICISASQDSTAITEALVPLRAKDANTCLYEAIHTVVEYVRSSADDRRQIMLIISDGLQDTGSVGITRQEIETQLEQVSIPIYAFCASHASRASQEELGLFARTTGGTAFSFSPDTAAQIWGEWNDQLKDCRVLCYQANSNRADGAEHTLLFKVSDGSRTENFSYSLCLTDWLPDNDPPRITSAAYDAAGNTITLYFSESVLFAEKTDSYRILKSEKNWSVDAVTQDPDGSYQLALPDDLAPGEYQLVFSGITDDSMEENPLEADAFLFQRPIRVSDILPFVLGIAVVLVLIAVAILLHRKKRSGASQSQRIEYEIQHVPAAESVVIGSSQEEPDTAWLLLRGLEGAQSGKTFELQIRKSSIWGRSAAMCDVCFEDRRVSKQHCVLEVQAGTISITDLSSQNGTYVNDIRLFGPRLLQKGDKLRLGDTILRIERIRSSC